MGVQVTCGVEVRLADEARDISPLIRSFTWLDSMLDGGWSFSAVFTTDNWDEWTDLLLGPESPTTSFRLTTVDGDTPLATEWRRAFLDTSRSVFRSTALTGQLRGGDRRLLMGQKQRRRAWPKSKVSDIVSKIGEEYNLDVNAEPSLGERDRWQLLETDWAFLRRLLTRSATESGRGDTFIWLQENTLHYGAPDLTATSARRHDLAEVENRVDRLVVGYNGRVVDRLGGASYRAVGFDLAKKEALVFDADADAASTFPALARRVPRKPEDGLRLGVVAEESHELVEAATRAVWGAGAPRYFSVRLDTRPDLALRVGSVVDIQMSLGTRQDTPFTGRFVVLEVRHDYTSGAIVTTAVCFRREAYEGEADPTGSSAAKIGTTDSYRFDQPNQPRVVLVAESLD